MKTSTLLLECVTNGRNQTDVQKDQKTKEKKRFII